MMNSFEAGFTERMPLSHGLVRTVRLLGEFKGKESLFKQQAPQMLEVLREIAVIQSVESSNAIEGITAPYDRIRALVAEKTSPLNRSEEEIAGYRDALNTIHSSHKDMPFIANVVLQLHGYLYRYSQIQGGEWKRTPNTISEERPDGTKVIRFQPVAPHLTHDAMIRLHEQFAVEWEGERIDKLLLIPAYILDFLCIHPFSDGNGRMARLLTLLLLYHAGYEVGRYISLEKIIDGTRETYYEALYKSSQGWHEGKHSLLSWTEYLLGIMMATYREFEGRAGDLKSKRGYKKAMVLNAISNMQGEFNLQKIREICPSVTDITIRKILQSERNLGHISQIGSGPKAKWQQNT